MASAKKGKKNKGKTLALIDFLQETPGPVTTIPIRKSTVNWADEVEDNHDMYDSRTAKTSLVLPTAPKASRDFDDIIDKVPHDPPYIAYLTNLPYDVDENEISYFFKNMKIANMRIPKDERPGEMPKLKGFGYVEFEDRESLLNALVIPDTTLKNRRIRIEVATDYDFDKRRSGRMDMNRERSGRSDVGDWRSGPRQENPDGEQRRGGFNRDKERDGGGFSRDKERDDSSGAWREGSRPNRDMERGGGFSRSNDRFRSDDRGDQEFTRGPREERGGGGFMQRRYDRDDRRNGGGGFSRNAPRDEADSNRNEPRQRPKLVLTPRSKPVENEPEKAAASAAIFGNAKPVDTSARERQIEERLLAKDSEAAPPPPKRELSKERRDVQLEKENLGQKEKKDKERVPSESDKKSAEKIPVSHNQKNDVNGVVDKEKTNDKTHEKSHHQKRNGDHEKKEPLKEGGDKASKPEVRKREEKKEKGEKEMPKLKKAEPPNFISSNTFAYLQTDDNSD